MDIEVVSSTKYLSGGGTSLGGLVIDYGTFPNINKRIKGDLIYNLGAYMSPYSAYQQTLGLETLDVRYQRQAANALAVAEEQGEPLDNIPRNAKKQGYNVLSTEHVEGTTYRVTIKK